MTSDKTTSAINAGTKTKPIYLHAKAAVLLTFLSSRVHYIMPMNHQVVVLLATGMVKTDDPKCSLGKELMIELTVKGEKAQRRMKKLVFANYAGVR
jgi:hypothetical protein